MTVEADTARIFRHAAEVLTVQDSPVRPEEVGFRRYRTGSGSTLCMDLRDDRMGRRLVVQWRQEPQLRELEVASPIGIDDVATPESAASALLLIASSMDGDRSRPVRTRDRKAIELCAAIGSVRGCLQPARGMPKTESLRVWAGTSVTPPFLRFDRRLGALERSLMRFIDGYRTTRANMNLQPSSSLGVQKERFELSGAMEIMRCPAGGGVVEAMRQVSLARSLAHPDLRPIEAIDAALAEAGA
jgi:hypothetical protein